MSRRNGAERKTWLTAVACALVLAGCARFSAAQEFALKDGQTVVFYGDSITAQRLYTRDVEEFVLTRYPSLHIRFVNAGVPGDTATGGYAGTMPERVARDVKPYQPNMITVMLGMNDGGWGYGSPAQIEADFETHYAALLYALHAAAPGATLTLIAPTPYDEITHGTEFPGYARMIDRFAADVQRIAGQMRTAGDPPILFANFHQPVVEALERAHDHDPQLAPLLIPDRIHPGGAGHWVMAAALMKAWRADAVVSSAALNAAEAKTIEAERTSISELHQSAGELDWTQLDEALPLPLDFNDAMTPLLLEISTIADLDREMLRVETLEPGRYELSIDGKPIATFSGDELRRGVNLALYKTPMLNQARGIAAMEEQRAKLDEARFILSADLEPTATSGISEATLRSAQDELAARIRAEADPKPHHFALRRDQAASDRGEQKP